MFSENQHNEENNIIIENNTASLLPVTVLVPSKYILSIDITMYHYIVIENVINQTFHS